MKYIIDFKKMQEYAEGQPEDAVNVIRRDRMKGKNLCCTIQLYSINSICCSWCSRDTYLKGQGVEITIVHGKVNLKNLLVHQEGLLV